MTRTLIIYWMGAFLFAMIMGMSNAWADCRWEVTGTLEGERAGFPGNPPTVWPISGREIRLEARWANMACPQVGFNSVECAWSTVAWASSNTDSQGNFTIQSSAFPDPVCQKDRDFRVQVRGYPVTNWTVAGQVDDITGPNGFQGPQIPMATHRARLGTVRTGVYPAPTEVEWDRGDTDDDEEDDRGSRLEPRLEPRTNLPGDRRGNSRLGDPQISEVPCGMETSGLGLSTEFRFGAMDATGNNVSSDRALRIETRPNGVGRMTLNRLTVHILVENAGQRGFTPSNRCPAKITLRLNEGPGERGDGEEAWFGYEGNMPAVSGNAVAAYEDNGNLLGAGDDFADEPWDHTWEYVLVEVTLDTDNDVIETAEGDNVVQHCYHAPTNSFASMSSCSSK